MSRPSAAEVLARVLDAGTFVPWPGPSDPPHTSPAYAA
ncbi:MAG: hypothetical protein JWN57_330, partial [Frankiales bacterium]|nr:hypothetical protein [Frankiales bacterium]